MSSNLTAWVPIPGEIVPKSYTAGYVSLSYVVSYVGAWTTLELINRRTAVRGQWNWLLLVGASISMGGIAIWCMHFIGNRSMVLGDGSMDVQVAYSAGYTILSFFIPIVVLFLAFTAVGPNEKVNTLRVFTGGFLSGVGICGMHYLGQAGISNYSSIYAIANVVGAGVIAIVASILAFGLFFLWRSSWNSAWWKRCICAGFLAGAVSGMHWLASVGTKYRLTKVVSSSAARVSRRAMVIVVIVLSISACFILVSLSLIIRLRRTRSANRAEKVVLATAIFDDYGRIMLTTEGDLPAREITTAYLERSFDDIFEVAHPAFLWIFRVTRNWSSIVHLLPGMRNHVRLVDANNSSMEKDMTLVDEQGSPTEDYSILFRELFCVAAAELADDIDQPLEKMGVLYSEILSTGQVKPRPRPSSAHDSVSEIESSSVYSRGQLLFLVNKVDRREAESFQAAGFRFATTANVTSILARRMAVERGQITHTIESMREFSKNPSQILEPGVHMACFAIRATVNGGFDVLARKDARSQLPTMQLPFASLESWHLKFLQEMDTFTVLACVKYLTTLSDSASHSKKEQVFASQLLHTLQALKEEMADSFFDEATLVAEPVQAPCRPEGENSPPSMATLITFKTFASIYTRPTSIKLEFVPLIFFNAQQYVYKNSPDHAAFARKVFREFAPVLDIGSRDSARRRGKRFPTSFFGRSNRYKGTKLGEESDAFDQVDPGLISKPAPVAKKSRSWLFGSNDNEERERFRSKNDNLSEKSLFETRSGEPPLFNGIMISQEVSVDVGTQSRPNLERTESGKGTPVAIELREMPSTPKGETVNNISISMEDRDRQTFVDHLFNVCVISR